jgi:hypothetical protein
MNSKIPTTRLGTFRVPIIVCLIAFVGLGVIMTVRNLTKPSGCADFDVYYLGCQVAKQGAWDGLYPIPIPDARKHPGHADASEPKPRYKRIADAAGLKDPHRYIYSPPSAILIIPFVHGSLESSIVGWWTLMGACCVGSALVSGAFYERLAGRRDWLWATVILAGAWCPLTWATIRAANTSAASSLMVGLTLYGLVTRKSGLTSLAFYAGAALKFATIPLLLIPLFLGRYRIVTICAIVSIILTIACIAVTGIGPWREYVALLPTLSRPNSYPINISVLALINWFVPTDYRAIAMAGRQATLVISLGVVLYGLYRNRHQEGTGAVLAGGSALMGWFLVFAPTTHNHYFSYILPLWGYYVAEGRQSRLARLAALLVIGGSIIPIGGGSRDLSPLLQTHMLWSAGAALIYGIARLYQKPAHLSALGQSSESAGAAFP